MSDQQNHCFRRVASSPFHMKVLRFQLLIAAFAWILFFGTPLQGGATPITVTVSPGSVTLTPGSTQRFTVMVQGTAKTAVTWFCATANGWVDAATGEYTAPMNLGTYVVKATLNSDPTKYGTATITVARNIQVALNKTFIYAYSGDVVQLRASVTGGTNNALGVAWSTIGGAIQGSGPSALDLLVPTPGIYVVSAASIEDPMKTASVSFEVLDPSVITLQTWSSISGQPFSLVNLSATVRGGSTQRAIWSATGGSLSSHETASDERLVYQLPTTPGAYSVLVSAKDDPTKSVTIPVNVQSAASPTIYGIEARNHVFMPGSTAQIVPYFYAGGSTSTLDHGIGSVTNGGVYGVQPASLTQYQLTLNINSQTSTTQMSDWVAPGIAALATTDAVLTAATAYDQRPGGQSTVIRPDGKIVVAGGGSIGPEVAFWGKMDTAVVPLPDERVFDPVTGQTTIRAGVLRASHAALMQADGRISYFGGAPRDGHVFDPTITDPANYDQPYGAEVNTFAGFRNRYSGGVVLQGLDGKVVLIGGKGAWTPYSNAAHTEAFSSVRQGPTNWVEIRDLVTGATELMRMQHAREGGVALLLKDGQIFVAGSGRPELLNLTTRTSTIIAGLAGFWDSRNSVALSSVIGAVQMTDGKVLILENQLAEQVHWVGIWDPVVNAYSRKLMLPLPPGSGYFMGSALGDGLIPVGTVTRANATNGAQESYIFFYDSVKNAVVSTSNLNAQPGQELLSYVRWLGPTAQGDVLVSGRYGAYPGSSGNPEQLVRVRLSIPVSIFPGILSLPTGAVFKLSAWSASGETISWSVLEGAAGGTVSADGTYQAPVKPGIYHVAATSSIGRAVATLNVVPIRPYIASVQVDPSNGTGGSTVTVRWDVQWADSLHLQMRDANGVNLQDLDVTGMTSTSIVATSATRSFTIVASNQTGTSEVSAPFTQWEVYRVNISPAGGQNMAVSTARAFSASVDGAPGTPGTVTWSSVPSGAVTGDGVFTAPNVPGTYSVTATSLFDSSKSITSSISVGVPPTITSLTASSQIVAPGSPVTLDWVASGSTYQVISIPPDASGAGAQSWNVTGLSRYTLYPTRTATYTLSANSYFGGASRDVQVVVSPVTAIAITPSKATGYTGIPLTFGASITSAGSLGVTWSTDDARGSLSSNGLSAVYTPGMTPGTYHVTVTSVLDPTRSATAEVTVIRPQVTLSITPSDSALVTGQSLSLSSSIQVTGSGDTGLVWTCSGGSILPKGTAAFYTAPLVAGLYTVTATSAANPDVSATSVIQVSAPSSATPVLGILPQAATLQPGQRLYLGVAYTTTDASLGLDWAATGGNLAPDASTASAFFTSPTAGNYQVTATSRTSPVLTSSMAITVESAKAPAWSVTPSALTLGTGQSTLLEAVDSSGVVRSKVIWTVQEGTAGGLVTDAGQYFAPMVAGIYHLVGVNPDDPTQASTATITVIASGGGIGGGGALPTNQGVTVAPDVVSIPSGTYQGLSAVVTGLEDQSVTWAVENGPATASVDASGVFVANQPGTYRVFATSGANPVLNGSGVITVVSSMQTLPSAVAGQALKGYSVTALKDGRILIAGGFDGANYLATAQVFDPLTKTFAVAGNLLQARAYHHAVLLDDGRVLIADGWGLYQNPCLPSAGYMQESQPRPIPWAEVYDPASGTFQQLPAYTRACGSIPGLMYDSHKDGASIKMGNGQVLVQGGWWTYNDLQIPASEDWTFPVFRDLFDPGTNQFDLSGAGHTYADEFGPWQALENLDGGSVLVTGGRTRAWAPITGQEYPEVSKQSWLFSSTTHQYRGGPAMVQPRASHTATKLADGRILLVGGKTAYVGNGWLTDQEEPYYDTATAEIYDPVAGTFTPAGSLQESREGHAALLLPTGRVMILGGRHWVGHDQYTFPKTIELFDPDSGTFTVMDHLDYGVEEPKLALEPDGGVLVMGTVKGLLPAQQSTQKQMGLANSESSSASSLLALNSVLVAQVAPQDRSELHPMEAALKTATTSSLAGCSLAGQRPTLARISIPLPDNADLTAGTQPLPIGTNSNAAYLLLKSIRPNLPGISLRGYSVVLEVVNDTTSAVVYQKVMVGGGTPDNPTPLSLAQAQQSGLFQRVQSQADVPIPNQLIAATLQDYIQREPLQDERRLTPQEKELLYKHRKSWAILGWTRSMLPANPENNPNRAFYKVQINFSSNNGVRQDIIPYGLSALGISFPNEAWSFRFRVKAHYDQEVTSITIRNEVFKPLWSVAQLFRNWFVPIWDNDKWVSPELFRWLFQRDPVGEFSNRDLLEPANDFTLEHGHNESHKGHFEGNEADTYHPGYQAFTHSDTTNGNGGDFRDSYLIPYLQIARGDLVNPDISGAHATEVLIDWIRRARSRIFGLMTRSRKGEYGPDTFIYMCRNTTSTNLDIRDCYQLRRLLLVGECDPYSVGGTPYQGLNLVSSVGVWGVDETKWTGLADTSHTDHFHCKWAKKELKFNPIGTQEN